MNKNSMLRVGARTSGTVDVEMEGKKNLSKSKQGKSEQKKPIFLLLLISGCVDHHVTYSVCRQE